jgi:hypothetical protein
MATVCRWMISTLKISLKKIISHITRWCAILFNSDFQEPASLMIPDCLSRNDMPLQAMSFKSIPIFIIFVPAYDQQP